MSEDLTDREELRGKAPSHVKLGDHERPQLDHVLYTAPDRPPDTVGMNPEDGLPQPMAAHSMEDARAPAMSPANFVCMADTSEFVLRNGWGQVLARFRPDEVERTDDGRWRVTLLQSVAKGVSFLDALRSVRGRWCLVSPVRPQCRHYHRQLRPWPDSPDRQQCIRYCGALRDEHGELISLNDQALTACELRDPPAPDRTKLIDQFDEKVIASGAHPAWDSEEFDVQKELEREGGIFSGKGS